MTQKQKSTVHREYAEVLNEAHNTEAKKQGYLKKEGRMAIISSKKSCSETVCGKLQA